MIGTFHNPFWYQPLFSICSCFSPRADRLTSAQDAKRLKFPDLAPRVREDLREDRQRQRGYHKRSTKPPKGVVHCCSAKTMNLIPTLKHRDRVQWYSSQKSAIHFHSFRRWTRRRVPQKADIFVADGQSPLVIFADGLRSILHV